MGHGEFVGRTRERKPRPLCAQQGDESREILSEECRTACVGLARVWPLLFACVGSPARNNLWCFWKLDQLIKNQLFFAHKRTRRSGRTLQQPTSSDPMTAWLGTVVPSSVPESAAWWQVALDRRPTEPIRQ